MNIYAKAADNISRALVSGRTFPNQVFTFGWSHFRFFDDALMRSAAFASVINQLLELESAACACMANVDSGTNAHIEPRAVHLDRRSPIEALAAVTQGPVNWVTSMVCVGASSDVGGWCAYCEPMAEIAVIAFRSSALYERAGDVLTELQARTVTQQIAEPHSWVFKHAAMNPAYFDRLVVEYAEAAKTGLSA